MMEDKLPVTEANLKDVFTYHTPEPDQIRNYQKLRDEALNFAQVILETTPICADQQAAIRYVRQAVMTANAAIALRGGV